MGSRYGDDVTRALPEVGVAGRLSIGLTKASDAVASEETEKALFGLAWEVGCDLLTGAAPTTRSQLIVWTEQKAVSFGITFLGDSASQFVDAVMDAAGDEDPNEAADACNRIPDSGL